MLGTLFAPIRRSVVDLQFEGIIQTLQAGEGFFHIRGNSDIPQMLQGGEHGEIRDLGSLDMQIFNFRMVFNECLELLLIAGSEVDSADLHVFDMLEPLIRIDAAHSHPIVFRTGGEEGEVLYIFVIDIDAEAAAFVGRIREITLREGAEIRDLRVVETEVSVFCFSLERRQIGDGGAVQEELLEIEHFVEGSDILQLCAVAVRFAILSVLLVYLLVK